MPQQSTFIFPTSSNARATRHKTNLLLLHRKIAQSRRQPAEAAAEGAAVAAPGAAAAGAGVERIVQASAVVRGRRDAHRGHVALPLQAGVLLQHARLQPEAAAAGGQEEKRQQRRVVTIRQRPMQRVLLQAREPALTNSSSVQVCSTVARVVN